MLGKYQYGRPGLGVGTEYFAFTSALRNLGHDVLHFESWDRRAYAGLARLNQELFDLVRGEKPDVLLAVQKDCEIWTETIDSINALGRTATVAWTTDDSWKYREVSRFIGRHYHAITTTYPAAVESYRGDGIETVLVTQWAANSAWLREPLPAASCRYGVSFVGSAYGERKDLIAGLRDRGLHVECFGDGWPSGAVAVEELPRVLRDSLVSLNFADGFKRGLQSQVKARTFEVPGAGGLLATEHAPGLKDCYAPGKEILVFSDLDDLVAQVRRIKSCPAERDAIAHAGFLRTKREHTYERRLAEVLEFALEAKRRSRAPVKAEGIGRAIRRHRVGLALSGLRVLLVMLCSLIWGPERGRRAARRVVFEASWRLLGERTFASVGLPGRLFPEL